MVDPLGVERGERLDPAGQVVVEVQVHAAKFSKARASLNGNLVHWVQRRHACNGRMPHECRHQSLTDAGIFRQCLRLLPADLLAAAGRGVRHRAQATRRSADEPTSDLRLRPGPAGDAGLPRPPPRSTAMVSAASKRCRIRVPDGAAGHTGNCRIGRRWSAKNRRPIGLRRRVPVQGREVLSRLASDPGNRLRIRVSVDAREQRPGRLPLSCGRAARC